MLIGAPRATLEDGEVGDANRQADELGGEECGHVCCGWNGWELNSRGYRVVEAGNWWFGQRKGGGGM